MNFKSISFIAIILVISSCASTQTSKSSELTDQLRAENSLMKKSLELLQRENEVLKNENFQNKKDIDDFNAKIEKLVSDLDAFKDKYNKDITFRDTQYTNLLQKNAILEKESTTKILELNNLNKKIEKDLGDKIILLQNSSITQQRLFNLERENMKNDWAKKEFDYSRQIADLNRLLTAKDIQISVLKITNAELSIKLNDALNNLSQQNKQNKTNYNSGKEKSELK